MLRSFVMLPARYGDLCEKALKALGIDHLVLAIHDASFPGEPGDDAGRGVPASRGGARFLAFARALGFTGIQLGPAGQTFESNASPYDGTAFSRNILSIALLELVEPGPFGALLDRRTLEEIAAGKPEALDRTHYRYALRAQVRALEEAFSRFASGRAPALTERARRFATENAAWLEREVPRTDRRRFEEHVFRQLLAHEQHAALRERAKELGLLLYGDLQIGFSVQDASSYREYFLEGYVMGAPPSRTNPKGQPWGYPLLDPSGNADNARRLLRARMDKMFAEFDGVRIDHPHGWVCPWAYKGAFRGDDMDPAAAVRAGARLFSSPDLPDHPALARFSIARSDQIRRDLPRYADHWVTDLTDEQVEQYGLLFEEIVAAAHRHGRSHADLVCEVLSTMPFPLERVLAHHGLGRFRVMQKANLSDSSDVYRMENAEPEDWVMLGTHDTLPIFRLARSWAGTPLGEQWARHLGARLSRARREAESFSDAISKGGPDLLVHALFADLCASKARNVMVFFSDLFGLVDVYNRPGTVNEENWSLRLEPDFERHYLEKLGRGEALNLPRALAIALRARDARAGAEDWALAIALDGLAEELSQIGRL